MINRLFLCSRSNKDHGDGLELHPSATLAKPLVQVVDAAAGPDQPVLSKAVQAAVPSIAQTIQNTLVPRLDELFERKAKEIEIRTAATIQEHTAVLHAEIQQLKTASHGSGAASSDSVRSEVRNISDQTIAEIAEDSRAQKSVQSDLSDESACDSSDYDFTDESGMGVPAHLVRTACSSDFLDEPMSDPSVYAVRGQKISAICSSWAECQAVGRRNPGCLARKFSTRSEAETWVCDSTSA